MDQNSLAAGRSTVTLLKSPTLPLSQRELTKVMTERPERRSPTAPAVRSRESKKARSPAATNGHEDGRFTTVSDRFFRQLVLGMRNGVLAVTRDGRVAVMNEVAYRILTSSRARTTSDARLDDVLSQPARHRPHPVGGVRPGAPAEPGRAAAEAVGQGDRLHAVAHPRRARASPKARRCSSRT